MIRNIISLTSACVMLIASFHLIRDILKLSPKTIISIAFQKSINSKEMIIELSKQHANNKIGFFLLVFALLCQFFVLSTYPTIRHMGPPSGLSIIISIIISIILFFLSLYFSNCIWLRTIKKIDKLTKDITATSSETEE